MSVDMKPIMYFYALMAGFINAAVGSGGGMICVPALKKLGLDQKKAQATTLCIILPLTAISAFIYAFNKDYSPIQAFEYIPAGVLGAIVGVALTKKVENRFLKKIFALFMLWSGIRMLIG